MKSIVLLASLFFSLNTFADFPKNNLRIPVNAFLRNDMTEERFNEIINRVSAIYTPIVKAKKAVLVFNNNWSDETVNASANRFGGTAWFVNMYGGLARHPLVTDDGFMLVVCHELGHHLGGAPVKGGITGYWAATEGQADYFGTLKCMKRVLSNDDNATIVANMTIDPELNIQCNNVYHNENEIALCKRIGMAGKSLAMLLSSLVDNSAVDFKTPDTSIVKKTNKDHPKAQCRLDTYLAGDLCPKDFTEENGKKDPRVGSCVKSEGYDKKATRPLCWYKPGRGE